jgi:hypothetical protein
MRDTVGRRCIWSICIDRPRAVGKHVLGIVRQRRPTYIVAIDRAQILGEFTLRGRVGGSCER